MGDGAGIPFHPLAPRVGTSPAALAVEAPEEELVTVLLEGPAPPVCLRRVCSSDSSVNYRDFPSQQKDTQASSVKPSPVLAEM
ncbi:unnamed protein product [Rangifer tarandus platyrhynchus]|uniref:Uncharacterized protein n=1 Tax=Rangifer tarandus platyrhynchus TaxID=3082113 RepID=A0ABN8ZCG3_RANTA|nr:unnamed protein product [Rangifer tarandus platyrhynchus]